MPEGLEELVDELFGAVAPRLVDAKLELLLVALETPARVRKYLRAVAADPSIQRGDGVPFAKACARWRITHWCERLHKARARAPEPTTPALRTSAVVAKQNTERAARLVASLGKHA